MDQRQPPRNDFTTEENALLSMRLSLAQAFAQLLMEGYDALLHYGINYRELESYKDSTVLDDANKFKPDIARSMIMSWIERVSHDIRAAVRRKQFRKV